MLPAPKNGQVRAVPDERTIRYYGAIGLLDGPAAMRGRTAHYGERHVAQIVAIKRMQGAGKSLAEIRRCGRRWTTTLARMSGVAMPKSRRTDFWKRAPAPRLAPATAAASPGTRVTPPPAELHLALTAAARSRCNSPPTSRCHPRISPHFAPLPHLIAELARRGLAPRRPHDAVATDHPDV